MRYREQGLPRLTLDLDGDRQLVMGSKGVVRKVHDELRRVDIETEDGSLLTHVIVATPYLPPVHQDGEQPSHVIYFHMRGTADAVCWPLEWRRLLSPADTPDSAHGDDPPERKLYHLHSYIFRSSNITTRVTHDNRWIIESEAGDYIQYDEATREVRVHAPTVFVGTEDATRREYQRDTYIKDIMDHIYLGTDTADRIQYDNGEKIQGVSPKILLGQTGGENQDGLSYFAQQLLHALSTLEVRLTAGAAINLYAPQINFTRPPSAGAPVDIRLGNPTADQRLMLGDLVLAAMNTFRAAFNAHTHSNVQNGPGTSGAPTTPVSPLTDSILSDIARVSKAGA